MYLPIPDKQLYCLPNSYDTILPHKYAGQGRNDSMSISLCFRGNDGLLLATDSAMTIFSKDGRTLHTDYNSQKIFKITKNMGVTSIGSHEDYRKYVLNKIIETYKDSEQAKVEDVISIVKEDYLNRIKGYSENEVIRMHYGMAMTIVGYEGSTPYIISVESQTEGGVSYAPGVRPYRCIHGLDSIADYLIFKLNLDKQLEEGLSLEELIKIATFLILETSSYMNGVGGLIQMATITPKDGFCFVDKDVVEDLTQKMKRKSSFVKLSRLLKD